MPSQDNTAALMAAVEVGLFTAVSEGAGTYEEVARALAIHVTNAERLMVMLCAIGLLEKSEGRHRNAADVERFLVAGKTGYDLIVPSSNWAKLQLDGGLLSKLDKTQLPNLKYLDPAVQAQLARMDPGNDYMVNWLWGFTTVGINVDKVKAALGGTPMPDNVWDLVFKPEYISKMKGCGVSFLDSATEVVPAALHYLGKPSFSKNPGDYAAAAALLGAGRVALRSQGFGDGAGNPLAWDRYAYAGNNPAKYIDPNEHWMLG